MKAALFLVASLMIVLACGPEKSSEQVVGAFESTVWLRTEGTDQGLGIAQLPDGSVLMTGRTAGGLGEDDGFVSRISASGELEWTTVVGSSGVDILLDIGVHSNGTIFSGGVSTGDYQGLNNSLFSDGALTAFDSAGLPLWSRLIGMGAINQLFVDLDGVIVSGSGMQPGRQDADGFVAKYNLDGEPLWKTWIRSEGSDSATGLVVDGDVLWVVGFTDGALFVEQSSGTLDGWIGRFDLEGDLLDGEQIDVREDESFTRVCLQRNGSLVVAGYSSDENGSIDATMRQYDASHSDFRTWRSSWPGSDAIYGLVCTSDGGVVVSGRQDVGDVSDGFRAGFSETLVNESVIVSGYPGRDEWVDLVEVPGAICFSGYRPYEANRRIDDLDAVIECF